MHYIENLRINGSILIIIVYSSSAKKICLLNGIGGTSIPLQSLVILYKACSFSLTCGLVHIDSEHRSSIIAALVKSFLICTFKFCF
jgi:hypothetical protein